MSWIIGGGGCQCFGQLIDTSGALVRARKIEALEARCPPCTLIENKILPPAGGPVGSMGRLLSADPHRQSLARPQCPGCTAYRYGQRHLNPSHAPHAAQLATPTLARIGPVGFFVSGGPIYALCVGRAALAGGLQRTA